MRKSFTYEDRRYFVRCSSEVDFERKKLLKIQEINGDRRVIRKKMAVSEWAQDWVDAYRPGVSAHWRRSNISVLERFCDQYGTFQLGRITQKNIQVYANRLANYAARTQKMHISVLKSFFQTAEDNGLTLSNPVRSIKLPRARQTTARRSITASEREAVLSVTDDFGLYIKVMMYCGLRTMEVAALNWSDYDAKRKVLNIKRAVKTDGKIGVPKSAAGVRTVPVPDALAELLEPGEPFSPMVPNRYGNRHTHKSVKTAWNHYKAELDVELKRRNPFDGVGDLVPYDFRHTYCTDLQDAGVPINVARELMGHSDISLTSRIYTHHSDETIEDTRNRLNAACHPRATTPETVAK